MNKGSYVEDIKNEQQYWQNHSENIKKAKFDFRNKNDFSTENPVQIWEDMPIMNMYFGRIKEQIFALSGKKGLKILELGSGSGWLSYELAKRGAAVVGYDIAKDVIDNLNTVIQKEEPHLDLHFKYADINNLELDKNTYDRVVIWDSLHHFSNAPKVIERVYASLKNDGLLIFNEHIGHHGIRGLISKVMALAGWLVLPTCESFLQKNSFVYHKFLKAIGKKTDKIAQVSPFEDVAEAHDYLPIVKKYFNIIQKKETLSFSRMFVARIRRKNREQKLRLAKKICALDEMLINTKLLKGEYLFIVAQKKAN